LANIEISDIQNIWTSIMEKNTTKVGRRWEVAIPSTLRRKYGLKEGSLVVAEAREEGVLLRPVVTIPIEVYTPERKAEFLLNSAITPEDYSWAVKEVRKMGIDPITSPRKKPKSL
jgi:AbrB family looped-hinge helix DNA binding protein